MVPSDLRLNRLHLALQAAMGWENQHLYSFDAGPCRWSLPDPHLGLDALPANKATLQEALAAAGNTLFHYTYDFGDDWRHRLTAELTDGPLPGQIYPRLLGAEGRCPPEDVGGPPGYEEFLAALADPAHERHAELLEWHGESFDPHAVDLLELDRAVQTAARRWSRPSKRKPA